LSIIAGGSEQSELGSGKEFGLEGAEDFIKDQRGEERAEGASLGESFPLEEGVPLALVADVPASIVGAVNEVEEGEQGGKVEADGVATSVTGACIEHIDDVQGNEDSRLLMGVCNIPTDEEVEEVGDGVNATVNGYAKLTGRVEAGGKAGTVVCHNNRPRYAPPCGANADGTEFCRVRRVLVEG
jgi:hypothetical protein